MDSQPPSKSAPAASLSDYLAAERTFLAWIRTGLALMGFGFVIARFGLFLQEFQAMQHVQSPEAGGASHWFGIVVIVAGVFVSILAGLRHIRLVEELNRGVTSHFRPSAQAIAVAFFLALVGIAMAIYLVTVRTPTAGNTSTPTTLRSL